MRKSVSNFLEISENFRRSYWINFQKAFGEIPRNFENGSEKFWRTKGVIRGKFTINLKKFWGNCETVMKQPRGNFSKILPPWVAASSCGAVNATSFVILKPGGRKTKAQYRKTNYTHSWCSFKLLGMVLCKLTFSVCALHNRWIHMHVTAIWWVHSILFISGTGKGSVSGYSKSYNFSTGKKWSS